MPFKLQVRNICCVIPLLTESAMLTCQQSCQARTFSSSVAAVYPAANWHYPAVIAFLRVLYIKPKDAVSCCVTTFAMQNMQPMCLRWLWSHAPSVYQHCCGSVPHYHNSARPMRGCSQHAEYAATRGSAAECWAAGPRPKGLAAHLKQADPAQRLCRLSSCRIRVSICNDNHCTPSHHTSAI